MRERAARGLGGEAVAPLAVLFALNAIDELDRTAFAVLTPQIRADFHASFGVITAVIGLVGALTVVGGLYVGYLADRYSRVRLTLGAGALWALFCIGTGIAPGLILLAAFRVGSGIAKAVNDPTHKSLLADYYPPDARGWAYYAHSSANALGTCAAPLLAGGLAHYWGWRAPFVLFAVPMLAVVAIGVVKLREPVRGKHERLAAGSSAELALVEDVPPSFAEAWRSVHAVPSIRRTLNALPFLAVAFVGVAGLTSLLLDDRFRVNELGIGLAFSVAALLQVAAFAWFGRATTKFVTSDPAKIYRFIGGATPFTVASLVAVGYAPTLFWAIVALCMLQVSLAPLIAGPSTVLSLVMPPRVRATGFSVGALYFLPGFALYAVVGAIADSHGFGWAFLAMCPFLVVGMGLVLLAGRTVASDMDAVWRATRVHAEMMTARQEGRAPLLVVKDLEVSYGSTQVLFGVDLTVDDGEIVALLGTNGAGKSTLLNAITGLAQPDRGTILYDGRDITSLPAEEATGLGVIMVPGGKGIFPTTTVGENLRLAHWLFDREPGEAVRGSLDEVLAFFPILQERWSERAGNLSGGEQQMLTLGQAFIARPKLLLIDELSLGLAPVIVEQLLGIVRAIHQSGVTVLLVEQSVNVAITLADRAVFMEKGTVRFDGPTRELLDRPDVLHAVFLSGASNGAKRSSKARTGKPAGALSPVQPALEVDHLGVSFGGISAVQDVSFTVAEREILGLIGPNGAGKTTVLDLISGFVRPSTGRVLINGSDVTALGPDQRACRGLGRSFQDGRLWQSMTVADCLAVALERHHTTRDPVAAALNSPATRRAERAISNRVDELIDLFNLGSFANKFLSELSTGSRRVVDLACCVAHEPSVLLLDEPSSGIAQRETEALAPLLLDIRDKTGAAIVVIEHDMPLIQTVSDRLVALEAGQFVTAGRPVDVVNHPRVIEAYLGGSDAVIQRSGVRAT